MSKKFTPWFPASMKPVRTGLYDVKQCGLRSKANWDGKGWTGTRWLVKEVWGDTWRGLASDPEAS